MILDSYTKDYLELNYPYYVWIPFKEDFRQITYIMETRYLGSKAPKIESGFCTSESNDNRFLIIVAKLDDGSYANIVVDTVAHCMTVTRLGSDDTLYHKVAALWYSIYTYEPLLSEPALQKHFFEYVMENIDKFKVLPENEYSDVLPMFVDTYVYKDNFSDAITYISFNDDYCHVYCILNNSVDRNGKKTYIGTCNIAVPELQDIVTTLRSKVYDTPLPANIALRDACNFALAFHEYMVSNKILPIYAEKVMSDILDKCSDKGLKNITATLNNLCKREE